MDDEQKKYYKALTENIFSKSPEEREAYLKELKKKDGQYYEQIEHLMHFLASREDLLEDYAYHRIKSILEGLSEEE